MKECFSWILVLLFCQNRFTQNFVQARVRNKGGGYSEFEPIHTGSEDEGFCRKATLFIFFLHFINLILPNTCKRHLQKRRLHHNFQSIVEPSPQVVPVVQIHKWYLIDKLYRTLSKRDFQSREEETRSIQSRSHMMARMQKQTTRAQQRTNIRERYGLQPDMLDTGKCDHSFNLSTISNNHTYKKRLYLDQKY